MTEAPRATPRKRRVTLLKAAIGVTIFALVLRRVEWGRFLEIVAGLDPRWLLAAYGVFLLDRLFMAGKWRYLLRGLGVRLSFFDAVRHYFAGGLVGTAAQFQLGGDAFRVLTVGREAGKIGHVAASVIIEKLAGAAALGLWAAAAVIILNRQVALVTGSVGIGLAIALLAGITGAGLLAVAFGPRLMERLAHRFPQVRVDDARAGLATARGSRRLMGTFFVLTLIEQAAPIIDTYLIARALGIDLSMWAVIGAIPIITFVVRMPINIDGLGVREGLTLVLLGWMGVAATEAVVLAVVTRAMYFTGLSFGALTCTLVQRLGAQGGTAAIAAPERHA